MAADGNFWGAPAENKKSTDSTSAESSKNAKPKLSFRERVEQNLNWLVLLVAIISTLVATAVMNIDHADHTTNKFYSSIDIDNGDLKINWERYQTVDVELSESFTITESGTYHLTGTLADGVITIDAGVGEVRLLLDNATIKNSTGPAIYCISAEDLVIESTGENILADSSEYATTYNEDVTGAIYSKADLTFQGDGTLNLTGHNTHGILGKDDVKFNGGAYNITAANAIQGKDSIYIVNGNLTINATANAFKSTNDTDAGKGFVLIEGGDLAVTSSRGKGINSVKSVLIYGGNLTFDTYDDAIHSDNYVGVVDGDITIKSGDDGIHAASELIIDGGAVKITQAYEGLEAQITTINAGDISVVASDDGINAGSSDSTTTQGGMGTFDVDESCILTINGGTVYVNAAGDGVDSNGWIYFNGGTVIVDGPTNNGNGALDSGAGIVMNGGTVLAIGSSGMAETLGGTSSINNVSIYFNTIEPADTKVEIKDADGNTIMSHTAAKQFAHLAYGSEQLISNGTYTVYVNDTEYQTFTISDVTTVVGKNRQNFNNKK